MELSIENIPLDFIEKGEFCEFQMLKVIRLYKTTRFDRMKTQFNLTSLNLEKFFMFFLRSQKNIFERKG